MTYCPGTSRPHLADRHSMHHVEGMQKKRGNETALNAPIRLSHSQHPRLLLVEVWHLPASHGSEALPAQRALLRRRRDQTDLLDLVQKGGRSS